MVFAAPTTSTNLRRAFSSKPPDTITQEPYDTNDKHLRQLIKLRPGDRAEVRDLWEYTQDLLYGHEIQRSLFVFVLPFCLEAWQADLAGARSEYGGFVEQFYPVLGKQTILRTCLNPKQLAAVSEFMRESILEEIDAQRGLTYQGTGARPYRWIGALTSFGALFSDVDRLVTSWWSNDTFGKGTATAQYVSCLMYPQNENPVFAPWTPDRGGGPPCLWQLEGHLYDHHWLPANILFLQQNLNPERVGEVLAQAVQKLVNEPEYKIAEAMYKDLPLCADTLAARCSELPQRLQSAQKINKTDEWNI